ncbi:hypothetical protein SEA_LIBERTYBELL_52 [Streptomyces phage LibertyBell]|nr:hypothetical protein SEA_LIBERTYBELL_52 [Streptomyces phage LibertyBell]
MSEQAPKIIGELKFTSEIALTPEQLQAQQDFYDQWTAPTTEPVDFEAERAAYLARRQLVENPIVTQDSDGNFVVMGEVDIEPQEHPEGSFGFTEPKLF